eukprot:12411428-Karenia_brevis.AAC.1
MCTGWTRRCTPCSVRRTNTSLRSTYSMRPTAPFTKPRSLSRLRVKRIRMPAAKTRLPSPTLGSAGTPSSFRRARASGKSAATRRLLMAAAAAFVTVKNVKAFPVAPSIARACRTAVSKLLSKRLFWKK